MPTQFSGSLSRAHQEGPASREIGSQCQEKGLMGKVENNQGKLSLGTPLSPPSHFAAFSSRAEKEEKSQPSGELCICHSNYLSSAVEKTLAVQFLAKITTAFRSDTKAPDANLLTSIKQISQHDPGGKQHDVAGNPGPALPGTFGNNTPCE